MNKISKDSMVTLSYQIKSGDEILDEKSIKNPISYLHGYGFLLPAVELVLEGQQAGFKTHLKVPAEDAYGPYDDSLLKKMNSSQFDPSVKLKVGMKFETEGPDGESLSVRIVEIKEKEVVVDGNHPFAGLNLEFQLQVLEVRDASQDEIDYFLNDLVENQNLH